VTRRWIRPGPLWPLMVILGIIVGGPVRHVTALGGSKGLVNHERVT
jgi:hypothetical protein